MINTSLEDGVGAGGIAFYRGNSSVSQPIATVDLQYQPNWITRNSDCSYTINKTGVYCFMLIAWISWSGTGKQWWYFKINVAGTEYSTNCLTDNWGWGNGMCITTVAVNAGSKITLNLAPSRAYNIIDPQHFLIWKAI